MFQSLRDASLLRRALFSVVLAGFALAALMSVSPELHSVVHHDADDAHHECLATLLDASGCDAAAPAPVLAPCPVVFATVLTTLHPQWVEPLFLNGSVRERAPPVIS